MEVTTIVRAQATYACIKTEDVSLDVRLESGRSAPASLRQWAAEQVTTAERLQRNAGLALAAAMQLEHGGSSGSSGSRKRPYRCTDCGHIQQVTEVLCDGHVYAGSGANWCDACNSGKPEPMPLACEAGTGESTDQNDEIQRAAGLTPMNTTTSPKAGTPRAAIARFWRLHQLGRSAALDINTETGELACLATVSDGGAEGLGTPGQPYSDCWTRVVQTTKGMLGPSK